MRLHVLLCGCAASALPMLVMSCVGDDPPALAPVVVIPDAGAADSSDGPMAATCSVDKAFSPPAPIPELAANGTEGFLHLSGNGRTAYFSAVQAGGGTDAGEGTWPRDLFWAERPTLEAPFTNVTALGVVNSSENDESPSVSEDGLTLVFASTRRGGKGISDLYIATRDSRDVDFGAPLAIDATNTSSSESSPYLRADGNALYFVRLTTAFSHKLLRSAKNGSSFIAPSEVSELNVGDVAYPVVSPDDLVIYYGVTNGANVDVWVATRTARSEPFGDAHPVSELNALRAGSPTFLSADRCTLYLTRRTYDDAGVEERRALFVATRQP